MSSVMVQKYIYKMCWYSSKRSFKENTSMYFLKEEHTRWGHNWVEGRNGSQRCEIKVICVDENSNEYKCAVSNSNLHKNDETTKK